MNTIGTVLNPDTVVTKMNDITNRIDTSGVPALVQNFVDGTAGGTYQERFIAIMNAIQAHNDTLIAAPDAELDDLFIYHIVTDGQLAIAVITTDTTQGSDYVVVQGMTSRGYDATFKTDGSGDAVIDTIQQQVTTYVIPYERIATLHIPGISQAAIDGLKAARSNYDKRYTIIFHRLEGEIRTLRSLQASGNYRRYLIGVTRTFETALDNLPITNETGAYNHVSKFLSDYINNVRSMFCKNFVKTSIIKMVADDEIASAVDDTRIRNCFTYDELVMILNTFTNFIPDVPGYIVRELDPYRP